MSSSQGPSQVNAANDAARTSTPAKPLAAGPAAVLQKLAEQVLALCRADSAAVSLLEPGGVRWHATAGACAASPHWTTAQEASPCSIVVQRDAVQLFRQPERHFPGLRSLTPPIHELLMAPIHVAGRAAGAVWAAAQSNETV